MSINISDEYKEYHVILRYIRSNFTVNLNLCVWLENLIISVYLSSLQVAHLSDAPRRLLVVTGESARIQDETTENSAWFFNVLGV